MLPPQKLAQELAQRGVLVFNKAVAADIVAAAEATAKATGGKPTFEVALVPGWHHRHVPKTADLYLHGSTLIGNASGVFVDPGLLILGDRPRKFSSRGDRRVWRKLVKRFAAGQPLLTFLIAAAFASMILSRLGIQPFVILLWGPSSTGKSSAAVFIGAIFGGDPSRPQHSFVESFKVTEAGIEKLGLSHNDVLLLLDEFSRVRGTAAQKIAVLEGFGDDYCAGVGKVRGNDQYSGLQWSGAALITSNHSYAQLLDKADQAPAESMGPRLIEIPADMKAGMGIFTSLPDGCRNSTQASDEMRAEALTVFGLAAPEFAEKLIQAERQDTKGIAAKLAAWKRDFVEWAGPELTAVLGQLRDKFAAIYAAGMLAKHLGVLPKSLKIRAAVRWAWRAVIRGRPKDPVAALEEYIEKNRSHFPRTPLAKNVTEVMAEGMSGFRHKNGKHLEYLFPKAAFDRFCKPLGGSVKVMQALHAQGLAACENAAAGKYQVKRQLGAGLRIRVYCVSAAIRKRNSNGA